MSKTNKCLEMLLILNARSIVNANELALILDTNVRNISEYKKELESIGYVIETKMGKNGGYYLDKTVLIPPLKFDQVEKQVLEEASDFINKRYDFLNKNNYNKAMGKVFSSFSLTKTSDEILIIDRYPLNMEASELKKRYDIINESIVENKKIQIEYSSLKNVTKTHIVHPYQLYIYNNCWFFIGYNETIKDIGYFKLNRIVNFKALGAKFTVKSTFDIYDYVDHYGMKNNGKYYNVTLKVMNESAKVISERIYGKNQTLEFLDDNTTILKCSMQNKNIITSFVLGFGEDMLVIEPQWLKEEVVKKVQNIKKMYE